ncbi:hypothetical protein DFH09DRAFT_1202579 [Mycena vulgaris]|nr:hypothetical protein DFH09DRAFT_1202579 [Mycena vulgaris]
MALGWTLSSGISTRGAVASGALFLLVLSLCPMIVLDLAVASARPCHLFLGCHLSFLTAPFDSFSGVARRIPAQVVSQSLEAHITHLLLLRLVTRCLPDPWT